MTDENTITKPQNRKKLFGVQNPIGKALLYVAFVIFTGGFGLILLLIALIGDKLLTKRKTQSDKHQ